MITIANRKVAGFEPRWASFKGFSLLFDNPGNSLAPMGSVYKINCSMTSPDLKLYEAFTGALDKIGHDLLTNSYLFCPLPPYSYHVTVWDGVNDDNIAKVTAADLPDFERFLNDLPGSILDGTGFTKIINGTPLVTTKRRPITFRFDKLTKWGNGVLVARLAPADEGSSAYLDQVAEERKDLNAEFAGQFGVKTSSSDFSPHMSLGYFANQEHGELATSQIDNWTDIFKEKVGNLTITFESIDLYGFTNMATFFKA